MVPQAPTADRAHYSSAHDRRRQAAFRASLNNDPAQAGPFHRQIDATVTRLTGCTMTPLGGDALYPRIRAAHTIVATSEPALFANVILRKGVISLGGPG